ncbi:lysylphosphatidylglycerol synthase transmembrane domain-containing protein [Rarobacter incanus]|uniref:Uncharacterized protein (TIRG00374 family) n=1 Tax=Rarobacter incanus TaxID=153494 RepID=A0A542SQ77_9MICO|nr:lysylphosphatidylglycerol synthase transmembrane domain-containing protein [Rarobacter incanus]TQK76738.1 uncharacterized protein (TIRG00374 family) [Rarobacter incanus]
MAHSGDEQLRPRVRILDDEIPRRVRHPRDLVAIVLAVLGSALVLMLAVFAHETAAGIADDVRQVSTVFTQVLSIPVRVMEFFLIVAAPIAVLIELMIGRAFRQAAFTLVASLAGSALGIGTVFLLDSFASRNMLIGLSVWSHGSLTLTVPVYVAALSALLTMAGPRTRRKSVRVTWNLLWVGLALVLIAGQVTIPGAALAILVGRIGGLAVRYAAGVDNERAYGDDLVQALRRVGFDPIALARVRDVTDTEAVLSRSARSDGPPVSAVALNEPLPTTTAIARTATDPASRAIVRQSRQRVYALTTPDGPRLDVVVLDGDRQVIGFLSRLWESIRLRGIEGGSGSSLRAVAERAALTAYAAEAAGVNTPRLRGVAAADDSMMLIQEHTHGAVPWRDLDCAEISDELLAEVWHQLLLAHSHGLSHRQLTSDTILVRSAQGAPTVWLTGWESGVVASSEFSRRLDLAQALALMTLSVGPQRAVRSAMSAGVDAASIGPLIQPPTLPTSTRARVRADRQVLKRLRAELAAQIPDADVEPLQVARFSPRRIVMTTLTVIALTVIITSVGFDDIKSAVSEANPWWFAIAFVLGVATWLGAAVALVALSPVRVPVKDAFMVQVASSFVTLAAPAGIGPAVLNLRLLTTRGVATSLAMATVTLVQFSQVVVTIIMLLVLILVTGDVAVFRALPSTTVVAAVVGVVLAVVVLLLVPRVRKWAAAKTVPLARKIWPRLSEVLMQPHRVAIALVGNLLMTFGFVLAFDASLRAFGQSVSLLDVTVVYLIGNTIGAAVPTPGGVGAVEFALITGLTTTAGVAAPIATSIVVLFRVVTYWGRIPFGWLAMQRLQRTNLV